MKTFLRLVVFTFCLGVVVYGLKKIPLQNIGSQLTDSSIFFQNKDTEFIEDWSAEDLLKKINSEREEKGFTKLKINDKLNKAALSRLSVIMTENDYSGNVTGITREIAIKNSGYNANLIGDLVLLDFFRSNDPIEDWESDSVTKETLLHPDFKEIGIAVKNDQDTVNVYVILVSPQRVVAATPAQRRATWGGPDLWKEVNKRRVELGVNPLGQKEELCTIASIRLNQLLELGKLDGHAGFVPTLDRPDLKWISDKYNISEFLAQGYNTPVETVAAWENTLGHKALLSGGEFVWGCVYAQDTFAVAISAY